MCKWGETEDIKVKIPADLSSTEREKWKATGIDKCIAPLVKALQKGGIDMRGSCCGHGIRWGDIHLQDGRMLVVVNANEYFNNKCRYLMKEIFRTIGFKIRTYAGSIKSGTRTFFNRK